MYYYQFNIGDYKAHTDHLDLLEDLAFRRMIDWCYLHECPLPLDINEIAKKILMRTHNDCIAYVLSEFFNKTSLGYVNNRVEKEVLLFKGKSDKARESANLRWSKIKADKERNANALDSDKKGNAKHKPLTTNQEPLTTNQLKDKSAKANESFEIFTYWKEVMKKNGQAQFGAKRLKAVKARLKDGYTVDQIKLAIKGCSLTPHNMGQNTQGKKFDCLELICRYGENIERFADNANNIAQQQLNDINTISTDFSAPEGFN